MGCNFESTYVSLENIMKFILILLLFSPAVYAQESTEKIPLSEVEKCAGKVAKETKDVLELLKKIIAKRKKAKKDEVATTK